MMLSYHYAIEFAKEQKEVFGGDMNAFLDVAIECIEKQIPQKPIIDFMPSGNFYWYCPNCSEVVKCHIVDTPMADEYNHNYCGGCGQAIDWSDEE
jgi:hypothetical protein